MESPDLGGIAGCGCGETGEGSAGVDAELKTGLGFSEAEGRHTGVVDLLGSGGGAGAGRAGSTTAGETAVVSGSACRARASRRSTCFPSSPTHSLARAISRFNRRISVVTSGFTGALYLVGRRKAKAEAGNLTARGGPAHCDRPGRTRTPGDAGAPAGPSRVSRGRLICSYLMSIIGRRRRHFPSAFTILTPATQSPSSWQRGGSRCCFLLSDRLT